MHSSRSRSNSRRPETWLPETWLIVIALALLSLGAGCSSDEPSELELCAEQSALTYNNFGDPFMRDWCTGCHSSDLPVGSRARAPITVNLDSREDVLLWLERIEVRALGEAPTMPPTAGPSEDELVLLEEWLRCGAP